MPVTSDCLSAAQLQGIVQGIFSSEEHARLSRHVAECAVCRQQLEQLGTMTLPPPGQEPAHGATSITAEYLSRGDVSTFLGQQRSKAKLSDIRIPGYEILEELGRGGMGVVYKARQLSLKRLVALKMILAGSHASDEELSRFCREAEAVARLQHPNIVQIYEIGSKDGVSYFSLELVDGSPLSRRIRKELPLPDQAAALSATLARAMDHAHQRGIVHRDLKPGNVLLMSDGTPKITDFGLAKELEADSGHTRTGAVIGTPSYMAPEQALGRVHDVGPLTDVYALGAILYEMLTGRPPFRGDSVLETLEQVRTQEAEPPSRHRAGIPRDLETICLKALAKDPKQRYASTLALANDLDRFRAGEPILARREGVISKLRRSFRRHAGKVAAVAAVLGVVALALVLVLSARTSSRVAELEKEIVAALDETKLEGTEAYVAGVKRLIDELEESAPASAAEQRQKLWERLKQWVAAQIDRAADLDEAAVRIAPALAMLGVQDAASLRNDLERRRDLWSSSFKLEAPFADADKILVRDSFRVEGDTLRIMTPKRKLAAKEKVVIPGLILTSQASPSNAEARIVFPRAALKEAENLGLAMNASATRGYTFVLQRSAEKAKTDPKSNQAAPAPGTLRLTIQRNGQVLVQQLVDPASLGAGPLEIWAKREGDFLQCQLNRLKVLVIYDPFPLGAAEPGAFGLVASHPVQVVRMTAARKFLAPKPKPLDQGDALFEQQEYNKAFDHYRHVGNTTADAELVQEARYKQAMCCLAVGRESEAVPLLQQVSSANSPRWPIMADCQLWLLLAARSDADSQLQAGAIIERLLGRRLRDKQLKEQDLVALLPQDIRQKLLKGVQLSRFDLFFRPGIAQVVRDLERVVTFQLLLEPGLQTMAGTGDLLLRAYRLAGREEDALKFASEILKPYTEPEGNDTVRRTVAQQTWILRRLGRNDEALTEVNRWMTGAFAPSNPRRMLQLCPDRARVYIARGAWKEAEADVDRVLADPGAISGVTLIDSWWLKGYLREQAGDTAGNKAAWQQGVSAYLASPNTSMGPFLAYCVMSSLSGQPTDEECRQMQRQFLSGLSGDPQARSVLDVVVRQQPAVIYRDMWRTPRGRQLARQLAFQQCSYLELGQVPFALIGAATVNHLVFPGAISADHEKLVWDLTQDALRAFNAGKLSENEVLTLGSTFSGVAWFWSGTQGKLEPHLRGPIAYVFGHRYLRLNQAKQAETFFQTALQAAPANSTLQRLAQGELDKLKKR